MRPPPINQRYDTRDINIDGNELRQRYGASNANFNGHDYANDTAPATPTSTATTTPTIRHHRATTTTGY